MSYNNNLFYAQLSISIIGLSITSALLFIDKQNQNIFLPIFTSLIFAWVPSPITNPNPSQNSGNNSEIKQTSSYSMNKILPKKQLTIDDVMPPQKKNIEKEEIPKQLNIV
jgi:hypothetical protein